ncbi:DUF4277 domain-containing protein [Streptomyces sp. NBC_01618]|uniref:DUF4277 domain-containing protein n=1 Tax=Streptomyces sp. NBC_01618 TaxID=2975900 RepID=UPI00386A35A1|nr:DUF4277 domain-containing protein [Streptomyces sp. NBC_01618]
MVEKRLGALPVAAEFLRRLDVAGIVDEVCPGGASAQLTHGQVIEALVVNRLTSPAPLVRVGDWARTWAVEEVFVSSRLYSTTTVWPGPWTRSRRSWTESRGRSAPGRSPSSGSTCRGCTGT